MAAAAVFVMGEGNEKTPMAIIKNATKIKFLQRKLTQKEVEKVFIKMEEDLYFPLLKDRAWEHKAD